MRDVLPDLDAWKARGDRAAVAMVVGVKRSAPRPPGAKMAVSSSGAISGAVSGGCVEGNIVMEAEELLAGDGPGKLLHFGILDEEAWDVGLPCGGEIDVWIERHEEDGLDDIARAGGRGARVTRLDTGARLLVDVDGSRTGGLGDPALDDRAAARAADLMWGEESLQVQIDDVPLFVDVVAPPPRLLIFGAVDFAAQLCTLARISGWRPFVIDPRTRFATRERFPDAEEVIGAWPDRALEQLGGIDRATAIAVLTHDPKLDDAALTIALRSEAGYIGAMGSRRAQERRRERLLELGLTDEDLERLAAPIGLDIGALTAEETALSIMAEVVALRHGHGGGRLKHAQGRIHEVGA